MKGKNQLTLTVLYAVALGMGISAIVLSVLGAENTQIFAGIGVACLGLAGLEHL